MYVTSPLSHITTVVTALSPPPLPITTTNTITTTTTCHHYCVNSPNNAFGHRLGLWYFLFSFHFVFLFANTLPQASLNLHYHLHHTNSPNNAKTLFELFGEFFLFLFSFVFSFADTLLPSGAVCWEDSRALLTKIIKSKTLVLFLCSLADGNSAAALAQWYKW